jgi:Domain of unknown function (DUF4348)
MKKNRLMKNLHYQIFAILVSLILCLSCNNSGKKVTGKISNEDFNIFYNRFYSDSIFQKSRIEFPLLGIHYINEDGKFESKELTKWQETEFHVIKNTFPDNDTVLIVGREIYKRRISKQDTLVIENVFLENSGFQIIKKFGIKERKWYLISYDEYNF